MVWILGILGAYVAICFVLAALYRHPSRATENTPTGFDEIAVGQVPVWVIGPEQPKAVFVMCHGYAGSRYSWIDEARELAAKGYRCYLPSMPAHGKNPDRVVGFGVTESEVALAISREVRKYGKPVVGVGVSLGGAAIWLACGKDPQAFDAVCTEGAFGDLSKATNAFLDCAIAGGRISFAPVRWIAEWQSGVKQASVMPVEGAAAFRGKPALVIHGTEDRLFPFHFGEQLADAAGSELWRVEGGKHAMCYEAAPDEYIERLDTLAKRCLVLSKSNP